MLLVLSKEKRRASWPFHISGVCVLLIPPTVGQAEDGVRLFGAS